MDDRKKFIEIKQLIIVIEDRDFAAGMGGVEPPTA